MSGFPWALGFSKPGFQSLTDTLTFINDNSQTYQLTSFHQMLFADGGWSVVRCCTRLTTCFTWFCLHKQPKTYLRNLLHIYTNHRTAFTQPSLPPLLISVDAPSVFCFYHLEWWCETENRATTSFGYCSSTASLRVWPHCVNVRRIRC